MRTRRVWNQHTYHITNINADLSLPAPEVASWGPSGFNNYRVSAQGRPNAPDLIVGPSILLSQCPEALVVRATVGNKGALGVPAGVKVRLFAGTDATGKLLGEQSTSGPVLPGGSINVDFTLSFVDIGPATSLFVDVDSDDVVRECIEDNNSASASVPGCKQ